MSSSQAIESSIYSLMAKRNLSTKSQFLTHELSNWLTGRKRLSPLPSDINAEGYWRLRTMEHKNIPSRGTGFKQVLIHLQLPFATMMKKTNNNKNIRYRCFTALCPQGITRNKIPYRIFNTGCPQGIPRNKTGCHCRERSEFSTWYSVWCPSQLQRSSLLSRARTKTK